ncbi:tetratricopeptide repeat protein [Mesoterricola silvestris]|uniref:Tetratricopeptide repeat protein n=1 Tax=Mesoterricola silvestris TaxID=2927979 RepID=A0AA48GIS9_9BACT|nr:tetratricopeptide repeat protein [Mesoterricola silvestris]BDU71829.1 hypothetical protein METEAL_10030 [Mesoterricola silvestris]
MPKTEKPAPPPRYAEGLRRHNAGDREGALAFFAELVRSFPGDAPAHYFHGLVLFRLGRFTEAVAPLRRSVELFPGEDAFVKLALAQGQTGDLPACLETLEEAARRLPASAEVRAYLGTTLRSLDRVEEALGAYGAALERDPDHVPALWGLGLALGMRDRHGEGMAALRRAIELDPAFPPPHFHLGVLAFAAGDPGETRRQEALLRTLAPSYAGRLILLLEGKLP